MKKKTKQLLTLCMVFVLLLIGYELLGIWQEQQEEKEAEPETEEIRIADFTSSEIMAYHYKNEAYEIGFEIDGTEYVNSEESDFPVNKTTVASQILTISNLQALQLVTNTDKTEFGLDEPVITISVTLSEGRERNFYVGDRALFEDGYYVLDVENDVIYLAEEAIYTEFTEEWSELLAMEEMQKPTTDQIVELSLTKSGEQTLRLTYDESQESPWKIVTEEEELDGDSDAIAEALEVFQNYSVKSAVTYCCEDFSVYGLSPAETVVSVTYLITTEEGEEKKETLRFEFSEEQEEESAYYVRINESEYVYKMTNYYMGKVTGFSAEDLKKTEEIETEENEAGTAKEQE